MYRLARWKKLTAIGMICALVSTENSIVNAVSVMDTGEVAEQNSAEPEKVELQDVWTLGPSDWILEQGQMRLQMLEGVNAYKDLLAEDMEAEIYSALEGYYQKVKNDDGDFSESLDFSLGSLKTESLDLTSEDFVPFCEAYQACFQNSLDAFVYDYGGVNWLDLGACELEVTYTGSLEEEIYQWSVEATWKLVCRWTEEDARSQMEELDAFLSENSFPEGSPEEKLEYVLEVLRTYAVSHDCDGEELSHVFWKLCERAEIACLLIPVLEDEERKVQCAISLGEEDWKLIDIEQIVSTLAEDVPVEEPGSVSDVPEPEAESAPIPKISLDFADIQIYGPEDAYTYTGNGIEPEITVLYGSEELILGTDYEIQYFSNLNVGTARAELWGMGDYEGNRTVPYEIIPAVLSADNLELDFSVGGRIPALSVSYNGQLLQNGQDYQAAYSVSSALGTGSVKVTGIGNFTGVVKQSYRIPLAVITPDHVIYEKFWEYTGKMVYAMPQQVAVNGRKLTRNTDYTISYRNASGQTIFAVASAGSYEMVITGKGNYAGEVILPFEVTKDRLMRKLDVSEISSQIYNGQEWCPEPVVTDPVSGKTLSKGIHYILTYQDNLDAGKAVITIAALPESGYAGDKTVYFSIGRHSVRADDIQILWPGSSENDNVYQPVPVVKMGEQELVQEKDFTLSYSYDEQKDCMVVEITGIGNFTGTRTEYREINPFAENIRCSLSEMVFTYTGQEIEPDVTVMLTDNGTQLELNKHYMVTYTDNVNAGEAFVIVQGIDEQGYTGRKVIPYTIESRSLNSEEITVEFARVQNFANGMVTPAFQVIDNGRILQNNEDYTFVSEKDGEGNIFRVTLTGIGNYTDSRVEEQELKSLSDTDIRMELSYYETEYTGHIQMPEVTLWDGDVLLIENSEYTAVYQDNRNAGTASVVVTGIGMYEGTLTETFEILPIDINRAAIAGLSDSQYWAVTEVDTTIRYESMRLRKGYDYTIELADRLVVGNNTVIIKGIGNYTGSVTRNLYVTFTEQNKVTLDSCMVEGYQEHAETLTVRLTSNAAQMLIQSGNDVYVARMDSAGTTILETTVARVAEDSDVAVLADFTLDALDLQIESEEVNGTIQPYFRSAMMSKYSLALKTDNGYQLVNTNPRYIENPEATAVMENTYTGYYEGKVASKKGVQDADYAYTKELGVNHVLLNVYLDELISTVPRTGYVPYVYKGQTYYFSDLIGLGNQIYGLNGWNNDYGGKPRNVTLVLLLRWRDDISYLIHPAARVRGAAPYYALNMQEPAARQTFEALFCYMGVKLGNHKKYRVCNWTLGNEVNCCQAWNYSGGMSLQQCVANYAEAFQLLYLGVRRTASTDRVFISLDHSWTAANSGHSGKAFLDYFAAYMNQTAPTMEWNLNYHPYSQPLNRNDFWNDYSNTTDSYYTPYISMRNIYVLTNYLTLLEQAYGKKAGSIRVILGEQGFSSVYGTGSENWQAAALAYGFYIATFNDRIDAYIIRAYLDDPAETATGLYLGLMDYYHRQKQSYAMYKYVDTVYSLNYTNSYLGMIGAGSWRQIVPYFDESKLTTEGF